MANVANLTACMITQQLQPEFWNWTEDERRAIEQADTKRIGEILLSRLENNGCKVENCYIILHDKDYIKESDKDGSPLIVMKEPHIHAVVKFVDNKQPAQRLDNIAKAIGLRMEQVEKPKRGKYGYDNLISYLCHVKYPEKKQYAPEDVITIKGRDYTEVYNERESDWIAARAKVATKVAKDQLQDILYGILKGTITKNDLLDPNSPYYVIYGTNRTKCDDALKTFLDAKAFRLTKELEDGKWKKSIYYVTGEAGAGKTFFCQKLIEACKMKALQESGEHWEVAKTPDKNGFDGWHGEEILFMDDTRPEDCAPRVWLNLMDNHNINPASARFKNKEKLCPRVVIITCTQPYREFFNAIAAKATSEPLEQFIRRLTLSVKVLNYDENDPHHIEVERIGRLSEQQAKSIGIPYGTTDKFSLPEFDAYDFVSDQVMDHSFRYQGRSAAEEVRLAYEQRAKLQQAENPTLDAPELLEASDQSDTHNAPDTQDAQEVIEISETEIIEIPETPENLITGDDQNV